MIDFIRRNSRPVELAQLHESEFDIASSVFEKGLSDAIDTRWDLLDGRVLQRREFDGTHDDDWNLATDGKL